MSLKTIILAGTLSVLATYVLLGSRSGRAYPQPNLTTDAPAKLETGDSPRAANLPSKLSTAHLANAVRLTDNVISGGLPNDAAAFAELQSLGVKTIISVDGLRPNVSLAESFGMRYVHLPHGYDGVPEVRGHELAKAVRELPGPIYIHCHRGQQRSPAAAAVACVEAGLLKPSQARRVLQLAGTAPNYRGLFRSVSTAQRQEDQLLAQLQVNFTSTAQIPPLAQAMVEIDALHEQLSAAESAEGSSRGDVADAEHALLLKEQFVELQRLAEAQQRPAAFRNLLQAAERAAEELQAALAGPPACAPPASTARAALARVNRSCTDCHRAYRDDPLR